jgi:hypothetical protein
MKMNLSDLRLRESKVRREAELLIEQIEAFKDQYSKTNRRLQLLNDAIDALEALENDK